MVLPGSVLAVEQRWRAIDAAADVCSAAYVALQPGRPQKLPQSRVGTLRQQRHSCLLVVCAGTYTTNHQDCDIRQNDALAPMTSFVATLDACAKAVNTPVGDVFYPPYLSGSHNSRIFRNVILHFPSLARHKTTMTMLYQDYS